MQTSKKRELQQTRQRIALIKYLGFLALLVVMGFIGLLWFARPKTSVIEKRDLTEFPKFTLQGVWDGSFCSQVDTWYADTYPLREGLISMDTKLESLYGVRGEQIVAGGQAVVYSAKEIARTLGMTETLIGLTVCSVGTSLPELVTSLVAAKKEETELAVGNVIGSNIFNMMMILGVSASIHPVTVNVASVWDLLILIAITVITWIFALVGKRINRVEGALMVLVYAAVVTFAIIR